MCNEIPNTLIDLIIWSEFLYREMFADCKLFVGVHKKQMLYFMQSIQHFRRTTSIPVVDLVCSIRPFADDDVIFSCDRLDPFLPA